MKVRFRVRQGCLPFSEPSKPQNSAQRKCLVWVSHGLTAWVSSLPPPQSQVEMLTLRIQLISPCGEAEQALFAVRTGLLGLFAKPQGDTGWRRQWARTGAELCL